MVDQKQISVSFSQFAKWLKCPHWWMWDYVKNQRQFEDSIFTCFGTAIHEPIQLYIKTLYTDGSLKAKQLDLISRFNTGFDTELKRTKVPYTPEEYVDFNQDGDEILNSFLKNTTLMKHFPANKYEYIGTELEIKMPIKNNLKFTAYLDLVLKEKITGKIKIIDLKTSTLGWNRYQIVDYTKISQLLLYKAFYSKKYNIPLSNIKIEFFIMKRKLLEDVRYPQTRIQSVVPSNTKAVITEAVVEFITFLDSCFTTDGQYKKDTTAYPKNPGKGKKNCKYCLHKKIRCDQKQELGKKS